jgi:glycine cleavage system H protein
MEFPEGLRYSAEHEWVRVEGARATAGITDFAQDALGDVVYVNLPEDGVAVVKAAGCAEVESTKSVSDIYAPVTGTVVAVNDTLDRAPEQINQDPYGSGWLFTIEMTDPTELDALLDAAAYRTLVEEGLNLP